jgi:hypothetical protein
MIVQNASHGLGLIANQADASTGNAGKSNDYIIRIVFMYF